MRTLVALMLALGIGLAFAGECHVSCPEGYHGGCVKSGPDCDCSCWENVQDAKDAILKALRQMGASSEVQEQAKSYLKDVDELPETTLTDRATKKQFIISLQTSKSER